MLMGALSKDTAQWHYENHWLSRQFRNWRWEVCCFLPSVLLLNLQLTWENWAAVSDLPVYLSSKYCGNGNQWLINLEGCLQNCSLITYNCNNFCICSQNVCPLFTQVPIDIESSVIHWNKRKCTNVILIIIQLCVFCLATRQKGTHAKNDAIFKGWKKKNNVWNTAERWRLCLKSIKRSWDQPRNPSFKNPATEGVTDAFLF